MASGDSFSRASVARPREGGHSRAALHRLRACVPRRDKIRIESIQDSFRKTTTTVTSKGQSGVEIHWPCLKIPSGDTVVWNQTTTTATFEGQLGVGSTGLASKFHRETPWAIRANPIGLKPNDHHSHLRESLRSREPLTLYQNSIGSHCGDLRP
ncbi:hypothetical protein CRG98_023856 [Punica granatum]|uniref:Uncharacterized protein n=1 Tax=Punica granatum TaxID=22663 RepID=A0A2I0JHQ7_PUNGR|nr:hypothetical protein CRG98_023856 [Punica granatum]